MERDLAISELGRAVAGLVRIGVVADVELDQARATVSIDGATTRPLPWLTQAGDVRSWSPPAVGEQVVVVVPNGDLGTAIILGSLYQASAAAPSDKDTITRQVFSDGAVIEYDREAHRLSATLPQGGSAVIEAPSGLTIKGDLAFQGSVSATGQVADGVGSMAADRTTFDQHTHTYVIPGGTAQTTPPSTPA